MKKLHDRRTKLQGEKSRERFAAKNRPCDSRAGSLSPFPRIRFVDGKGDRLHEELGRDLKNAFGSKDYAREELVAEMGSAFLCAALGIVPTVRHADYIGSWLEVLREDNRAIFRAASAASKAADWLLARHREAGETGIEGRIAA